jgi:DNA-binding transcriptional LysR family regulator
MNLRHWRNFLKVAQAGSLSRVADEIGVAQPVLSRQIRELEEELGAALF